MTFLDVVDVGALDFVRDQWGRPLIVPVSGGKPVPYTRASAAAKTVEDTYNLELWARRNIAYGMARDPSLVARTIALGGDPSTWNQATKKAANQIHEAAAEVALAHRAADIGTALHRMTEIVDGNQPLIAGPYEADIEAYVNAVAAAGFQIRQDLIECRLVCDELAMAGTADRIVWDCAAEVFKVADLKTGETVDYGGLGWAAQLAAYAHGLLYDIGNDVRLPTPNIDKTTGLIIHLPAGKGECTIYEIDLVAGYRAAELANEIRSVRREAKRWIRPLAASSPVAEAQQRHPSGSAVVSAATAEPTAACRSCGAAIRWTTTSSGKQMPVNAEPVDGVDVSHFATCPNANQHRGRSKLALVTELGRGHDEGDTIDEERYDKVRARYQALPDALQFWAGAIAAEANRAGVPFYLNEARTYRRYWLYAALILLAEHDTTEPDIIRALASGATGKASAFDETIPLGHVVGAMSVDEARKFCDAAAEI